MLRRGQSAGRGIQVSEDTPEGISTFFASIASRGGDSDSSIPLLLEESEMVEKLEARKSVVRVSETSEGRLLFMENVW